MIYFGRRFGRKTFVMIRAPIRISNQQPSRFVIGFVIGVALFILLLVAANYY